MATGKKVGRPPGDLVYPNRAQIKDEIVTWIAQGKTLREFCRQKGMPSFVTIYDWLRDDKEFDSRFMRARDAGHDVIAEECAALADLEPLAVFDEQGNKRYDPGSIAWRKMQIETRVKLLAKWNPRKYGDKTILAGDAEAPVAVAVDFTLFDAILKGAELAKQSDGQPS
jgi:hypothetical protein